MYRPLLEREGRCEEWDFTSSEYEVDISESEEYEEIWNIDHQESTKLLGNDEKTYGDPEVQEAQKKVKYPKSVFFIVGNEFCERFSYYGMKAILILYLNSQLKYNEDDSTVIYHIWAMLCYFTPIIGAIIADSWLGRFKTIFYISIIYVLGNAFLSVSAVPTIFNDLAGKKAMSFIGLLLIAFGTGGIKPCVSAFGGDQFVLPQQEKQLTQFFFVFYFSINAGSLLSTFITPILRDDVSCFGDDCYSLAFGVPAILMLTALVIFLIGYIARLYTIIPPQGTILKDVSGCIGEAVKKKWKSKEKKSHWLDYAKDKYGEELVADVKVLLKILYLYIPLPFFWALFDQQGSRWTFQATRMDGVVGGWTIKPDQMQVINPLLILILIPVFDKGVYPLLARCNLLKRQLPRMFTGGVMAGAAFLLSGFLELKLEETYPVAIASGSTRVTYINGLPCDIKINPAWNEDNIINLAHLEKYVEEFPLSVENDSLVLDYDTTNCNGSNIINSDFYNVTLMSGTAHVLLITANGSSSVVVNIDPPDETEKPRNGLPMLRLLYNIDVDGLSADSVVKLKGEYYYTFELGDESIAGTEFQEVEPDNYEVFLEGHHIGNVDVKLGGVYNFLVQQNSDPDSYELELYEVIPPNTVHMLWLLPQYFVLTASEIMFSITGLEFSFTQAPASMKSVLQAAWLLTVSFGNLIVVIIAEAQIFERQSMEFFLFAALMFVDMIAFALMAMSYKYVDEIEAEKITHETKQEKGHTNEAFTKDETKF